MTGKKSKAFNIYLEGGGGGAGAPGGGGAGFGASCLSAQLVISMVQIAASAAMLINFLFIIADVYTTINAENCGLF